MAKHAQIKPKSNAVRRTTAALSSGCFVCVDGGCPISAR